jgi:hypothetical protein
MDQNQFLTFMNQMQAQTGALVQQVQNAATAAASAAAAPASAAHASDVRRGTKIAPPSSFKGSPAYLDGWMSELQQQFAWYRYANDADKVALALAHLRDAALDWWMKLSAAENAKYSASFPEFEKALRLRFLPVDRARTARRALDSLQMGPKQSVQSYIAAFNQLITAIPTMDEEDKVHRFTSGLRTTLQEKVIMALPDSPTLAHAIAAATKIGGISQFASAGTSAIASGSAAPMDLSALQMFGIDASEFEGADSAPASDSSSAPVTRKELQEMQKSLLNALQQQRKGKTNDRGDRRVRRFPRIDGVTESQIRERLKAGQCFICGEEGHRANACPKSTN